MRVLLSLSWYLPNISGLTLALDRLARDLAAGGDEVTVLAGQHDRSLPREEVTPEGIRVRRVPVLFRLGKALVMPRMVLEAWREAGKADVVHLWLPQFDAAVVAIMARLRGRRVVATYNCSLTSPGIAGALAVWAVNLSHLVAGLLCHRISVNSEDYAAQSRFCRLFHRKLRFIDIPVPDWPEELRDYRKPRPPYRIGFIGRLSREKGLDTLLAAIPALRIALDAPFTVEIAGPGAELAGGSAADLLADPPPEVRIHGAIDDAARDAFFRTLHVLVLPSTDRIEAFGLVQVEAMLRGVPCVTSDRPGMRQPVLRTGFGDLFEPGNPDALARAVAEILTSGPPSTPDANRVAAEFCNLRSLAEYRQLYAE